MCDRSRIGDQEACGVSRMFGRGRGWTLVMAFKWWQCPQSAPERRALKHWLYFPWQATVAFNSAPV